MRKIIFILVVMTTSVAIGQIPNPPSIVSVSVAPSGSCASGLPNQQVLSTGVQYSCQGGTWAALGGGGGGAVSSVFGRTGAVTAVNSDYGNVYALNDSSSVFYFDGSSIEAGHLTTPTAVLSTGGFPNSWPNQLGALSWFSGHGTVYDDGVCSSTSTFKLQRYTTGNSTTGCGDQTGSQTVPAAHTVISAATGAGHKAYYFDGMSTVTNDCNSSIVLSTTISNEQTLLADVVADGGIMVFLTYGGVRDTVSACQAQIEGLNQALYDGTITAGVSPASYIILPSQIFLTNPNDTNTMADSLHPNNVGSLDIAQQTNAAMIARGEGVFMSNPYFIPAQLTAFEGLQVGSGNGTRGITGISTTGTAATVPVTGALATSVMKITNTNTANPAAIEFDDATPTLIGRIGAGNSSGATFADALFFQCTAVTATFCLNLDSTIGSRMMFKGGVAGNLNVDIANTTAAETGYSGINFDNASLAVMGSISHSGASATHFPDSMVINTNSATRSILMSTGFSTVWGGFNNGVFWMGNTLTPTSGPFQVTSLGIVTDGQTKFTATGCTSITSTVGTGTTGRFVIGANTCTVAITMNGATGMTAPNGWTCHANDETTLAGNTGLVFLANSATTATLTVPATAVASDVIDFDCRSY